MNAEIVSVGTELLLGDILNTNAQYLSRRLADLGIDLFSQVVIGDNEEKIFNTYAKAFKLSDIVITTGGLGPTEDDLTKEVSAMYFRKKLILDKETETAIKDHFKTLNIELTENNLKQAYLPEDCIKLKNDYGTAPGCIIEEKNKVLIILPGPPKEMIPMFENYVVPYLKSKQSSILVSKVLKVCGIGESKMETLVKDLIDNQTNPTIAPYAKETEALLRVTAKAETEQIALELIEPVINQIKERLGDNIYGEDEDTLESIVAKMLIEKHMTISVAESCTGGLLAGTLINYPGISKVFIEGAVTYSNESKIKRLGVKKQTLDEFGAVSSQTAIEMAEGIAKTFNTNIGLSTTGIAGPDGGTQQKPVGLVYIGLYINGITKAKELHLIGDREKIRIKAVSSILDWLRRELL